MWAKVHAKAIGGDRLTGYTATITSATLRLRESRIVADLLIRQANDDVWREIVFENNVLQMNSIESIRRVSRLLRARMEPLGSKIWLLIRDGDRLQATQAVLAGAVKHSRLLGDFMDIVLREQRSLFAQKLEYWMWDEYIGSCRGRDFKMPQWSESTIKKLRSSIFSMLSEAGYLENTRSLRLQTVFLDDQLRHCLREREERYVLRCLEVME
ncbi:MAG: hypothetical protein RLZZ568_1308 [Cyanobacteriota bacterium]